MPFAFSKEENCSEDDEALGVSVIIAAKNEADNLIAFLPKILSQEYPNFEVVVVDDHSTDNTWKTLKEMVRENKKLSIHQLPKAQNGKKKALQLGISKAKHPNLLFTDADCYPASDRWIKEMIKNKKEKSIVLGYGRYEKRKGILNKLIRYDTLYTGIRYLSFAYAGKPYMGVGRNLLYTRQIYHASEAFEKHQKIAFGDDDLLINEMSSNSNTSVSISPNSHTLSLPSSSFKAFFFQKLRHLGAGKFYKVSDKLRLVMEGLGRAIFLLSGIVLLLMGQWVVLVFLSMMCILQGLVLAKLSLKLDDKGIFGYHIFLEPIHLLLLVSCGLSSFLINKIIWK